MITLHTMDSFLLLPLLLLSLPTTSSASPFPPGSLPTSSGYLSISPNSTAALFYAFYEAQHPTTPLSSTPLLVWLQGGPGCSSLKANLLEFGPSLLSPTLRPNPYSWNRHFGLLFIENPLGVGFSTVPSPDLIPRDQPTVSRHLFAALQSFLSSNPSFRRRPLFLTGSSYGGKYIPAAGYHILTQNPHLPLSDRINLAGVAIGNGMTHPVTQVTTHAATAYYAGLINDQQRTHLESLQREAVRLIDSCNWSAAADTRIGLMNWLQNVTGLATMYDITKLEPYDFGVVGEFLNKEEVKAALGVREGAGWERCSAHVRSAFYEDLMKSVKYGVEELVRKSRVLLYQGVYDMQFGSASTEAWVKEMEWEGLERFMAAESKVWMMDGKRAGYVQRSESLSQVAVLGAGHIAAADQRRNVQAMIEDWVLEKGLFQDQSLAKEDPRLLRDANLVMDHEQEMM